MSKGDSSSGQVELWQLNYSHYNEKARWGLDHKRVPHVRKSFMPPFQAKPVQKLTGQRQVPVVRFDDGTAVAGSAEILAQLDARYPDNRLLPDDPDDQAKALEIQSWFDAEIGPKIRAALFDILLDHPRFMAEIFGVHHGPLVRTFYGLMTARIASRFRKVMGIESPEQVEAAREVTASGFDFVAENVGPSGFLAGDRFSIADLTAASLLALGVCPASPSMNWPEPRPNRVGQWLDTWRGHPGGQWVLGVFANHRPASAEI